MFVVDGLRQVECHGAVLLRCRDHTGGGRLGPRFGSGSGEDQDESVEQIGAKLTNDGCEAFTIGCHPMTIQQGGRAAHSTQ